VPFEQTGDLYALDDEAPAILRIDAQGRVSVAVTAAEIIAVTGEALVGFGDCAIAFDVAGAMYFTEAESDSVLRRSPQGELTVLLSRERILELTDDAGGDPEGLTFGADGMLYVLDDDAGMILRVDPASGEASVFITEDQLEEQARIGDVEIGGYLVGGRGGEIFFGNQGDLPGFLAVGPGPTVRVLISGANVGEFEGFLTLDRDGNLVIVDGERAMIRRLTPEGELTTLIPQIRLEEIFDDEVRFAGGAVYDSDGNFFLTDDKSDSIARLDPSLQGTVWIDADAVIPATGTDPDYQGGIAFAPR